MLQNWDKKEQENFRKAADIAISPIITHLILEQTLLGLQGLRR